MQIPLLFCKVGDGNVVVLLLSQICSFRLCHENWPLQSAGTFKRRFYGALSRRGFSTAASERKRTHMCSCDNSVPCHHEAAWLREALSQRLPSKYCLIVWLLALPVNGALIGTFLHPVFLCLYTQQSQATMLMLACWLTGVSYMKAWHKRGFKSRSCV